jgi:hypothetical protein
MSATLKTPAPPYKIKTENPRVGGSIPLLGTIFLFISSVLSLESPYFAGRWLEVGNVVGGGFSDFAKLGYPAADSPLRPLDSLGNLIRATSVETTISGPGYTCPRPR